MSEIESIIGIVKLKTNIRGMPEGGITVPKLRVELFEELTPDSAWIAELKILDELPWHEGEVRRVEILILTDEFRDYVVKKSPNLLVRNGSQVIGRLELE